MLTKEELKGKYIEYTPKITKEIFDKIIKHVESLGYTEDSSKYYTDYKGFKDYGGLRFNDGYEWNTIAQGSFSIYSKIKVSDILGKDWSKKPTSKFLKREDLVNDNCYYYDYGILFKQGTLGYINLNDRTRWLSGCSNKWIFKGKCLRLTTPEEKEWLEACIKADKFIPRDQIKIKDKPKMKHKYEIGEKVKLIATGSSVNCVITDAGKKCTGAKVGDIVTITGITYEHGKASKSDPRYYGDNFNVRGKGLEKITDSKFVLPEKWCILKNKEEICNWFNKRSTNLYTTGSRTSEYIHHPAYSGNTRVNQNIQSGYQEISFDDFKKYVLKEDTIPETKSEEYIIDKWYIIRKEDGSQQFDALIKFKGEEKGIGLNHGKDWTTGYNFDRKEEGRVTLATDSEIKERLLEYAKKQYPVGTTYNSSLDNHPGGIVTDIQWNYGNIKSGPKWLFNKETDKWAEIVSLPSEKEELKWYEKLKEGDYVVSLHSSGNFYTKNFIYKVYAEPGVGGKIKVIRDDGRRGGTSDTDNFRIATKEEAAMFEDAGNPVDVTTYKIKKMYTAREAPEDAVMIRVIKDIDPKKITTAGSCPFIPKGSITWFGRNKEQLIPRIGTTTTVHPENNRYSANIPGNYFELVEKPEIKEKLKFKVGKWYKVTDCNKCYRKCSKIPTTNSLPYSDRIESGTFNSSFNSTCRGLERLKEVSLEEIQDYLPEGHVDKIKPKEWSAGSWVVCTKHYTYLEVGDIAQIENDSSIYVNVTKHVGSGCLPYKTNLKWFATKKEAEVFAKTLKDRPLIETLKEGDFVYYVTGGNSYIACFNRYDEENYKYFDKYWIDTTDNSYDADVDTELKFENISDLRRATESEIKWLKACKERNQFIFEDEVGKEDVKQSDSSIPDKWCIKWTSKEVFKAVKKWANISWNYIEGASVSYDKQYYSSSETSPYTVITFEQFKKYVLKEGSNISKEKTMKYNIGSKIYFGDFGYTLKGGSKFFWDYGIGDNSKVFNHYDIDKSDFSKEVLGYYESGDFPEMKTLSDVKKFTDALIKEIERKKILSSTTASSDPKPRWKVGDTITYKKKEDCPGGRYSRGGDYPSLNNKGVIQSYNTYSEKKECYNITVTYNGTTAMTYNMIESEFEEWDIKSTSSLDIELKLKTFEVEQI